MVADVGRLLIGGFGGSVTGLQHSGGSCPAIARSAGEGEGGGSVAQVQGAILLILCTACAANKVLARMPRCREMRTPPHTSCRRPHTHHTSIAVGSRLMPWQLAATARPCALPPLTYALTCTSWREACPPQAFASAHTLDLGCFRARARSRR